MIKPTLFVGLGTTGTNILKSLRQLMSEEYGHAGLPIFRYVAIETDAAVDVGNSNQMKDYEQINLITATIDSFNAIRRKLNPKDPGYNANLVDWLNPDLLTFAGAFNAGAANIRMAGRLCLWENWGEMHNTITKAYAAIVAPAAMKEAGGVLGLPLGDGGAINVYVVGSLCGGSCSGMLIDVGYFCKELLGAGGNVYGIFTMYDKDLAGGNAAPTAVQSANCYASLQELNYYNHLLTTYEVTPPSGPVNRSKEPPYDYTILISRSGVTPIYKFVKTGGEFDEDGLNLMVALNLFAEAAGDTDGKKEAIRINFQGFPGYGELKEVPKGEIPIMTKCIASFGLTAVWYPKYRIASAAASLVNQRLCDNWIASHRPPATIVNEATQEWNKILNENIGILAAPKGQQPLKGRIEKLLGTAKTKFNSVNSAVLKSIMERFPENETFKDKFDQGGKYFELIEMQVPECKKAFHKAIEQILNIQLANINFSGTYGLGDVQAFFVALDKEIGKTIEKCPALAPSLDLNQLDFEPMRTAENNRWTRYIGLQAQSIEAHRKALIEKYAGLISENPTSIYVLVRNYFLRSVLQDVREILGFGVKPMENNNPNPFRTIKQRLDAISANLKVCAQKFTENWDDAIDPPTSECVKIVTNNSENKIDTDAEALSYHISQTDDGVALLDGNTMAAFLERKQDDIIAQMTETYRRLSLQQIQAHDVVKRASEILNAGGDEIRKLANRSNPYQTFNDVFEPFPLDPPPKIIFGHDPTKKTLDDLQPKLEFPVKGSTSVEHLLFFYQEEAGFAIDDLDSYLKLKRHFEDSPGPYGHLTHHDPDFYNLALYHKIQKLKRWCGALGRLVPEICQHINKNPFSDVFYPTKNGYVFEYKVDGLSQRLGLHDDKGGIKRFSKKQNEIAYDNFFNTVRLSFTQLDLDQIKKLINEMLKDIKDLDEHELLRKFFGHFWDDVYFNKDFPDDADSEAALDSDFFKVTPQIHQDTPTDEPDETPSNPYQQVDSESDLNATAETEHYTEVEEEDVELTTIQETQVNFGDTPQQDDATDEGEEGFATVETEPSSTVESDEEATPEQ